MCITTVKAMLNVRAEHASLCSTMWVGRQSRRVCFGAKPEKGFLDMKSRRIRKWEGDVREAVDGGPGRGS